ncbi:MAG: hypothetical protein R2705_03010 [Ilumatobacteraceae bacterium]
MSAVARLVAGIDGSGPMSLADHRRTYPAPHPPGPRPDLGLIEAVERAGLRGRGGAAFPTGTKLRTVASMKRTPVVLGNGSEGEPMSTKDKVLMTYLPHLVIDGAMLAAAAVGADEVVIGIEDGATSSWRAMQHALDERSGPEPHVPARLVPVPARYVSGEETALVNVVNGGPGLPTATPPRPFERGVSGRPTLVDNVETLAHLTQIARWGPAWFRQVGTVDEPGTVMVTMGGAVHRSGVQEVELGTTMRELVDLAGGAPRGVSAILCGGFYGAWLSASEAHRLPLTNADLRTYGAGVGCGMIGVLPSGCVRRAGDGAPAPAGWRARPPATVARAYTASLRWPERWKPWPPGPPNSACWINCNVGPARRGPRRLSVSRRRGPAAPFGTAGLRRRHRSTSLGTHLRRPAGVVDPEEDRAMSEYRIEVDIIACDGRGCARSGSRSGSISTTGDTRSSTRPRSDAASCPTQGRHGGVPGARAWLERLSARPRCADLR